MKILVLNAGSSSQKSCLYELTENRLQESKPKPKWEAHIDWTMVGEKGELTVISNNKKWQFNLTDNDRQKALFSMVKTLVEGESKIIDDLNEIDIVGHRVVHGGNKYSQPTLITPEVKKEIKQLFPLAPVHNPINLQGIEIIENILGNVPQVAVFDTAFHSQKPLKSAIYRCSLRRPTAMPMG